MKIALLSAANSTHTEKIANSLCDRGHQVVLYSQPDHGDRDGGYHSGVTIRYFRHGGQKSYFYNHFELKKWLAEDPVDVLNVHYATGYGVIGRMCGFHPCVLSVWGSDVYDFPYEGRFKRRLLEKNLKDADLLLSTSHCMARQTEQFARGKEIIVTPFGVDVTAFSPAAPAERDSVNIGFIKGVSRKYGIEFLIRAFRRVKDACREENVKLLVYGDGDQLEEMKALAFSLGIGQEVTFFGRIPHERVPDALHQMDIFCVPSTLDSESFGVSAVEAMACAIPCVTSDAAGLSEVMVDGETGYIVERENVEELAEKIILLVRDSQLRAAFGRNGRARVKALYDWEENIQTLESALIACAGGRNRYKK